jgi:p-aminobenzoyl-glutamate transporter AbgT
MLRKEEVESFDEQEDRARRRLRTAAWVKAALLAGVLVYVVPSGGPWMSTEAFTSAIGRALPQNVIVALVLHFLLAFLYGVAIAACIFRLPLGGGILVGAFLSFPLYGLNYLLLALGAGFAGNELHVFIAHFMFCLFFSAAYRAFAVPRARRTTDGAPVR